MCHGQQKCHRCFQDVERAEFLVVTCECLYTEVYRIKNFAQQNVPGSRAVNKVNEGTDIYP